MWYSFALSRGREVIIYSCLKQTFLRTVNVGSMIQRNKLFRNTDLYLSFSKCRFKVTPYYDFFQQLETEGVVPTRSPQGQIGQ